MDRNSSDELNRWCRCVTVDPVRLRAALESHPATTDLYASIRDRQPHLFSDTAVFVTRAQLAHMRDVVAAIESVTALPAWRDLALSRAPAIARVNHGPLGGILGYDFHVADGGPRLIEVNTNPGGILLNAALARAELACCPEVAALVADPTGATPAWSFVDPADRPEADATARAVAGLLRPGEPRATEVADDAPSDAARAGARGIEAAVLESFLAEYRLARGERSPRRVAIVDDEPETQYLHPEFVLFRELFAGAGIGAAIADPRELVHRDGALLLGGEPVDLVYNRLTDFSLKEPCHAALRAAHEAGDIVLTPHPRAHALRADKRNLVALSDPALLHSLGASEATADLLARAVPRTLEVAPGDADRWWAERRRWFFKPVAGFGGRAAYRGDKLTRAAFTQVVGGGYVAQEIVPPSERTIERDGVEVRLKLDLRCYAYAGRVDLVAARLYQGQTTNFRTPGGGFAPVFTERG